MASCFISIWTDGLELWLNQLKSSHGCGAGPRDGPEGEHDGVNNRPELQKDEQCIPNREREVGRPEQAFVLACMSASDQDGEQAKTKNMAVKTKDLANNGMPKRGRMTNRAKQRSTGSNLSVFGEIAQGVG